MEEIVSTEEKKTTRSFKIYNFNEAYVIPEYALNKTHHFIEWGANNVYPIYLLNLYNNYGSTTHKAIINKKIKLSTGYGFAEILDQNLLQYVKKNKLEKFMRQISADFELFNGFCFEVIWNREGTSFDVHYVPIHKIRRGVHNEDVDFDHYWFCNNWALFKKDEYKPELIRAYDPNVRIGRQLYYYIEENPVADNIYPQPSYSTGLNYVELDYEISKFHLNSVKQGFAPSFVLNFATGIPSLDEQDEFMREWKRNYQGSGNAGKIIITYSDGGDQKPELIPIEANSSDERFVILQDMVEKNIVMTHEIPPQLVVLTPGKLGSTTERNELLSEFQSYYITPRQEQLEEVINTVLKPLGFTEQLVLKEYKDENIQDDIQQREKEDIQGILLVQQSVASGITSYESAIEMMKLLYGFTEEEAKLIIGQPKTTTPIIETTKNYI
jgi:hypothetical protein